jgi:hypothetical protein
MIEDGFSGFMHTLKKSDYIVMNLRGPISELLITSNSRSTVSALEWIRPDAAKVLKDLRVGALNLANNHVADRGNQGYKDTRKYLDQAALLLKRLLSPSLLVTTPTGKHISISSFMGTPTFCCDSLNYRDETVHITLRPNMTHAELALNTIEKQGGADI